jgi:dihydrofolate reductase
MRPIKNIAESIHQADIAASKVKNGGTMGAVRETDVRSARRVRYGVAMSLDGYIAGPNGEADWIVHDPDIDFREMFSRFDTLLIGRRTYEAMLKMGGGRRSMPGVKSFIVSRTMKPADHPDVTIVRDAEGLVRDLKAQPGKDIWLFGGGELFRSLLAARLVDGVDAAIVPVLLGGGIPLLPSPAARAKLRLRNRRVYGKSGIVALEYDAVRD